MSGWDAGFPSFSSILAVINQPGCFMKSHGFAFVPAMIVLAAMLVGGSAYLITKKNDSPIEQAAEAILKSQGIDMDFSPDDDCGDVIEVCNG